MNQIKAISSNQVLIPIVALLYIAHALPLYFFNVAVPAILRQQGVDVRWIGMLSLLYLPWAFKFLWASLVDNHYSVRLGKRKTWLFITQILIVIGLLTLSQLNLAQVAGLLIVSFLISTASATQDIAIDGYTVEQFNQADFGMVSATQSVGVAVGSMVGGAGILWLYETYNWQTALIALAGLISVISIALGWMPDRHKSLVDSTVSIAKHKTVNKVNKASLNHLLQRASVKWLLLLIVVFRLVEAPAMAMLNPMLVDFGWNLKQIGFLFSVLGAVVGILAALSAGLLVKKYGAGHWLTVSGWLRTVIYTVLFVILLNQLPLMQLRLMGYNSFSLVIGATILALLAIRYMAMTALYTLFMTHSSQQQAGTDFTVFVCVELLVFFIGGALSGFLVHQFGYTNLFLLLSLLSALSMFVMPWFFRKIEST